MEMKQQISRWSELIFWKLSKSMIAICIIGLMVTVGSGFSANIILFLEIVMTPVVRCLLGMILFFGALWVIPIISDFFRKLRM